MAEDKIYPEHTVGALIERLHTELVPKGIAPLVRLQLGNAGFIEYEAVKAAVKQFEGHVASYPMSGPLNGLERLGMALLLGSLNRPMYVQVRGVQDDDRTPL